MSADMVRCRNFCKYKECSIDCRNSNKTAAIGCRHQENYLNCLMLIRLKEKYGMSYNQKQKKKDNNSSASKKCHGSTVFRRTCRWSVCDSCGKHYRMRKKHCPLLQTQQFCQEKEKQKSDVIEGRVEKKKQENRCMPTLSDWIQIVIAVITLLSVFYVRKTLIEMQNARDAAYHPCIVLNPREEKAEWDSDGVLLWLKEQTRPIENSYEEDENGQVHGHMKIPMTAFNPSSFFKYSAVNIGVGAATEISFEWVDFNSQKLNDYLCSQNSKYQGFFTYGEKSDVFECNDNLFLLDKERTYSLMYMEPEARDTYELYFPAQYSVLTGMILKEYERDTEPLPFLLLNIKFKDIQNKSFQEIIAISFTIIEKNIQPDGSGSVTYQYNPQLLEIIELKKK